MKKILLATTILGLSAGVAAADISWSASAGAGIASEAGLDYRAYSFMKVGIKGSAETDSGLTFSGSSSLKTGTEYNTGADLGDDFDDEDGSFGMPTISIGGAFGTISFSDDNIDFHDDSNTGDVSYEGTFGAISASVISDVDSGETSVKLGYSADNIAVSAAADSYDLSSGSASYTMGAITATLSTAFDKNGDTSRNQISALKLAYSANGISASAKVSDAETYDVTLGYSANGMTVDLETGEDVLGDVYSKVTGSYDLGGGLSIIAGADSDENAYLGAAMKF